MRMSPVAAAAALCVGLAGAALAGGAPAPRAPVGGPLRASHGAVVQPLSGTPVPPTGLSASSWMVADADTGEVLAAHNAHARHLPASTLKILTAVTLLPQLDPRRLVRVSYDDAAVDGSKVGLVPGMRYSVATLF